MISDLQVPQALYDSQLSFEIAAAWPAGFIVSLGMEPDFEAAAQADTYLEACQWLKEAAYKLFPDSAFARNMALWEKK